MMYDCNIIFSNEKLLYIGILHEDRLINVIPFNNFTDELFNRNLKIRIISDKMSCIQKASVTKILSSLGFIKEV